MCEGISLKFLSFLWLAKASNIIITVVMLRSPIVCSHASMRCKGLQLSYMLNWCATLAALILRACVCEVNVQLYNGSVLLKMQGRANIHAPKRGLPPAPGPATATF